jgi:hypothetical protein
LSFVQYENRDGYGILAVRISEENLLELCPLPRGNLTEHDLGDYLVSDNAGSYRVIEKELFESQFQR